MYLKFTCAYLYAYFNFEVCHVFTSIAYSHHALWIVSETCYQMICCVVFEVKFVGGMQYFKGLKMNLASLLEIE